MVRLTEEMVVARTRISDLTAVKKLNCWGTELTDVSILRDLKKVEVLSLSVNNIDTLADFQYCLNLQDLFVRKNNIKDLNEVCYLQNLPNLRNLWLGENPCSERDGYRLAVLRALPNLEKLDDKIVSTDEVQNALARGRILVHPLDMDASPTCSDSPSPQEVVAEYIDEGELDQRRRYNCSVDQQQQQHQQQSYAGRGSHRTTEDYQETDRKNANWNASPNFQHNYPQNNHYSYENGTNRSDNNTEGALTRSESRSILDNLTPVTNTLGIFKEYEEQALTGETERTRRRRRHSSSNGEDAFEENSRRANFAHPDTGDNEAGSQRSNVSQIESMGGNLVSPRTSYPPIDYSDERRSGERRDGIYEQQQHDDRRQNLFESDDVMRRSSTAPTAAYHHHTPVERDDAASRDREMAAASAAAAAAQGWVRHSEKDKCRFHYHRRPVTRNSNILSAVLCLVKELDYPSLEVVEMAVRNRMDELEE